MAADRAERKADTILSRTGAVLRRAGLGMLAAAYPPQCAACGAATDTPHGLCAACWSRLRLIGRPFCARTGAPFPYDVGGDLISPAAFADPPVYGRARAAAIYDGVAAELVKRLKFADRLDVARVMARLMASAGRDLIETAEVIVPAPMHRWRLLLRGHNQSAELARALGAIAGLPVDPSLLLKVRRTPPQARLTKAQRRENLAGAFAVPPAARLALAGRRVLVVDDVITTGATMNAAARVLKRAGAAEVDALAFALVVPGG
jgi:ComF family protein